jgi:hypothetical protein
VVDVVVDKVDEDFVAHAGGKEAAPVGAGQGFGDA